MSGKVRRRSLHDGYGLEKLGESQEAGHQVAWGGGWGRRERRGIPRGIFQTNLGRGTLTPLLKAQVEAEQTSSKRKGFDF